MVYCKPHAEQRRRCKDRVAFIGLPVIISRIKSKRKQHSQRSNLLPDGDFSFIDSKQSFKQMFSIQDHKYELKPSFASAFLQARPSFLTKHLKMNSGNKQHSDLKLKSDPAEPGRSRMTSDPFKGFWICSPAGTAPNEIDGNSRGLTLRYRCSPY